MVRSQGERSGDPGSSESMTIPCNRDSRSPYTSSAPHLPVPGPPPPSRRMIQCRIESHAPPPARPRLTFKRLFYPSSVRHPS
eukprot:764218-Hanusia_phi.AAC.1